MLRFIATKQTEKPEKYIFNKEVDFSTWETSYATSDYNLHQQQQSGRSIGAVLEALRPPVDLFVSQARPNLWPEIGGQCGLVRQAFPQSTSEGKGTPSPSVGVEGKLLQPITTANTVF